MCAHSRFAIGPQPLRLLLIDDHSDLAEMTADFVRDAGLEVRVACTGEAGLAAAEAFQPEIVLCDLSLPDMTGFDVARAVRVKPGGEGVVFAIHTGMGDADMRALENHVECREVNLFLSKPLTEEKLERLMAAFANFMNHAR